METSNYGYIKSQHSTLVWDNRILTVLKRWWRNHQTRMQLDQLPDHLLDDVGLTREQAHRESIRRFWDE